MVFISLKSRIIAKSNDTNMLGFALWFVQFCDIVLKHCLRTPKMLV